MGLGLSHRLIHWNKAREYPPRHCDRNWWFATSLCIEYILRASGLSLYFCFLFTYCRTSKRGQMPRLKRPFGPDHSGWWDYHVSRLWRGAMGGRKGHCLWWHLHPSGLMASRCPTGGAVLFTVAVALDEPGSKQCIAWRWYHGGKKKKKCNSVIYTIYRLFSFGQPDSSQQIFIAHYELGRCSTPGHMSTDNPHGSWGCAQWLGTQICDAAWLANIGNRWNLKHRNFQRRCTSTGCWPVGLVFLRKKLVYMNGWIS